MNFIMPHKLPVMLYNAFIKDGIRLYRVLPKSLKIRSWLLLFIHFFSAATETFTLLFISLFALSVAAPEAAAQNFLVRPFLNLIPPLAEFCSTPRHMVVFTSSMMVGFVGFKCLLTIFTSHQTTIFSEKVTLLVGRESINRYLAKNYYWHISPQSGEVIHKIMNRTYLAQFLILLLQLYGNFFCCLALFTSLFIAEPKLTLVVVTSFSMASLGVYALIRHQLDKAGQLASSTAIEESISMVALTKGIREIIIYRQQKITQEKMLSAVIRGLPARAFIAFCNIMPSQILEFVGFGTIGGVVIFMIGFRVPMQDIVSAASILMLTAWRVLPAVNRSLSFSVSLRGIRPRALICLELLETFVAEKMKPLPEPDPNFRFEKSLSLRHISFCYPQSSMEALSKLSVEIGRGQSIGLIGASGAGKSTLALLLTGLVQPTTGEFLIDGQPLSDSGLVAYTQKVGFVPQNPLLMDGTLADNVAFSQWGQNYDREKVKEICHLTAMEFVFSHPNGLDMPLNSNGGGLSGGQAQRVAIARALFADPEIIVFDEATSALDQASENVIKNTIEHLQGRVTTIIIAHRLTTVENCDALLWIENGTLKMTGPPEVVLPLYEKAMSQMLPADVSEAAPLS